MSDKDSEFTIKINSKVLDNMNERAFSTVGFEGMTKYEFVAMNILQSLCKREVTEDLQEFKKFNDVNDSLELAKEFFLQLEAEKLLLKGS